MHNFAFVAKDEIEIGTALKMDIKPWSRQRRFTSGELPSRREVIDRIVSISDERTRFIAAFMYLTGCRVGEMVRGNDGLPTVVRENVFKDGEYHDCLKFTLRNEKNPHKEFKVKILPVKICEDQELCNVIISLIRYFSHVPGKRRIEQLLSDSIGWNPHFLRHLRLTDLATRKKFTDQQLTRWAGWSDSRPARTYIKYRYEELL